MAAMPGAEIVRGDRRTIPGVHRPGHDAAYHRSHVRGTAAEPGPAWTSHRFPSLKTLHAIARLVERRTLGLR